MEDYDQIFNLSEIDKQILANKRRKMQEQKKLNMMAGMADSLQNTPGFAEFYTGRFNKKSNIGDKIKSLGSKENPKLDQLRQARMDNFKKKMLQYKDMKEGKKRQYDEDYESKLYQRDRNDKKSDDEAKFRRDLMLAKAKKASNPKLGAGGKIRLSAKDVQNVQEGVTVPTQLEDIYSLVKNNKDRFGPLDQMKSMVPGSPSQVVDAKIRATSQAFGRFMEGGVLRKEDEEKYRKMFPALGNTPEVAKGKLQVVDRLLNQKLQNDIKALDAAGYDVSPWADVMGRQVPEDSQMLAGDGGRPSPNAFNPSYYGVGDAAKASPARQAPKVKKTKAQSLGPGDVFMKNGKKYQVLEDGDSIKEVK